MIAHLNGTLVMKTTELAVVDVSGVGYELAIPLSTYTGLPALNQPVTLNVHTYLKDDSIQLYGFLTTREKALFRLLISVSGIGPKLARNILSGMAADDIVNSIAEGDRRRLGSIPGVGRKGTERMILELKDRVHVLGAPARQAGGAEASGTALNDAPLDDVISALNNLGYRPALSEDAARKAVNSLKGAFGFEELFKEALKTLSTSMR
ncbi:MAG: Holliday junction branch migration protein RuvA [Thermodesulfobacteriota bacterium]